MKHITIRNVDPQLARALEEERKRRGLSLNQTVKDVLRQALGVETDREYSNGIGRLAGDWTEEEYREFEQAVADFERIDEELWK